VTRGVNTRKCLSCKGNWACRRSRIAEQERHSAGEAYRRPPWSSSPPDQSDCRRRWVGGPVRGGAAGRDRRRGGAGPGTVGRVGGVAQAAGGARSGEGGAGSGDHAGRRRGLPSGPGRVEGSAGGVRAGGLGPDGVPAGGHPGRGRAAGAGRGAGGPGEGTGVGVEAGRRTGPARPCRRSAG
jgi:hypothetical protein